MEDLGVDLLLEAMKALMALDDSPEHDKLIDKIDKYLGERVDEGYAQAMNKE